jgi:ATP/maltotriose-dependent transcriptional regulator MalT
MRIVDDKRLRSMPQASMAFTALGQALAAEGSPGAAMESLEEGLILCRFQPEQGPWSMLHHLLATAWVAVTSGRLAQAQELTDAAAERVARFPDGMAMMASRLDAIQGALRERLAESGRAVPLTARELDVLRLLQGSLSLHEIGRELFLSANTVKTHTHAVYRKLGAHSRAEAVRLARESRLI